MNQGMIKRNSSKTIERFIIEYEGGQFDISDIVLRAKYAAGKKNIKDLSVYFQLETGMIYYIADGIEGSTSIATRDELSTEHIIDKNDNVYSFNKKKLVEMIEVYISDFDRRWEDEKFKWEAIKWFQNNWDINSTDFVSMLEKSLSKTFSLLNAKNYYPAEMIVELARHDQEKVRNMFKLLFDESIDICDRFTAFKKDADYVLKEIGGTKKHYQTENSISVYLWLRFPTKYYIYKYGVVKDVADTLNANYEFKTGKYENNIRNFYKMYDEICGELQQNDYLKDLLNNHLTDSCYSDPELKTLMIDLGVYISRFDEDESYFPLKKDYDPNITTDMWIDILRNQEITNDNNLLMFSMMIDYGRPATCTELSEKYGYSKYFFKSGSSTYAKKVAKYTQCPLPPNRINENARWWPILYVGRDASKDENGSYVWKIRKELKEALNKIDLPVIKDNLIMNNEHLFGLNTILYGPPGTGKTYSTVLYAVGICDNRNIEELKNKSYAELLERYNILKNSGRICFSTFHQSYGYEEFIEGIRPVIDESDEDNSDIRYTIEDGIFKKFCNQAMLPSDVSDSVSKYGLNKNPTVWKVSLETTGDNPTRTECLENGHIRIGWDQYGEVVTDDIDFSEYGGKTVLNSFMNKMQVGDVVLSCYSASTIDAIGVVTGDYEWHPEYDKYKRLRKVKWISKGINYNILDLNGGTSMTLSTVYKLKMSVSDVFKILDEVGVSDKTLNDSSSKNYVFIIDEINRGNISKIFGELITLIEETKRLGCSEAAEAILPYSHTSFGIPKNVYILGTMNTADRSIALMDTALRRRFSFEEMMPDSNVLRDMGINTISSDGQTIDVADMLDVINERIEYLYDREHTIGHAFFTVLADNPSIDKLAEIFENKVIPLLQEYFYEDYGKIQLVLGDNGKKEDEFKFILDKSIKTKDVFQGDTSELDLPEKKYVIQKSAFNKIQSYKMIADNL